MYKYAPNKIHFKMTELNKRGLFTIKFPFPSFTKLPMFTITKEREAHSHRQEPVRAVTGRQRRQVRCSVIGQASCAYIISSVQVGRNRIHRFLYLSVCPSACFAIRSHSTFVPRALSLGVKGQEREAGHSPQQGGPIPPLCYCLMKNQ
jgi:hypothetical protein